MLHQASCVLIGERALLIEGPPGSGKSSLALALIDRGATLVGDDGVNLATQGGRLLASPPPSIRGLIEIRNVGLVEMPSSEGTVCLSIRLDPGAPRYVDAADRTVICGCEIPGLALHPDSWALPLRAEWAMRIHGLMP